MKNEYIPFLSEIKEVIQHTAIEYTSQVLYYCHGTSCLLGGLTFILTMEVMCMKNKQFDFKDLMAFGSFILALLAFIFANV